MATRVSTTPAFHNHSTGHLVDELGTVKAQIADLETREKALRDELIRRSVAEADGELFRATITEAVRWTIDTAKVKREMGEAWWNARCRTGSVTTVAVKARTAALPIAA